MWASIRGRQLVVKLLLEHKADIEAKDSKGMIFNPTIAILWFVCSWGCSCVWLMWHSLIIQDVSQFRDRVRIRRFLLLHFGFACIKQIKIALK